MKGYVITPSLYSAWYFWKRNQENNDRTELLDVLNRVEKEKTPLMQAGIDFEARVREISNGCGCKNTDCLGAIDIGGIVIGGTWQHKVKRMFLNDLLYGVADVIKRDTIYDIKFIADAKKYEVGKYEYSIQHLVYMYGTGIRKFEYLISDGNDVFIEAYYWGKKSYDLLCERIFELKYSLLEDKELKNAFEKNWSIREGEDYGYLD